MVCLCILNYNYFSYILNYHFIFLMHNNREYNLCGSEVFKEDFSDGRSLGFKGWV